jgi:hypothetical protein
MPKQSLTFKQWIAVALLAGPPLVLVIGNIGPGRWMNLAQDAVIGRHSLSLSILAVLFLEFVLIWIVAKIVLLLTGRTIVNNLKKRKSDE